MLLTRSQAVSTSMTTKSGTGKSGAGWSGEMGAGTFITLS
jgi:hypothetical protein